MTNGKPIQIKSDLSMFTRSLKIRERFWDNEYHNDSLIRNKSTSIIKTNNEELSSISDNIESLEPFVIPVHDNLTKDERAALKDLSNNNNIVIKPADKGGATIIFDKDYYRDTLVKSGHLSTNTYSKVTENSDKSVFSKIINLVKKHKECLTNDERAYLTKFKWVSSQLYVLPKIHKCKELITQSTSDIDYVEIPPPYDLKGRPIVGGPESPTQQISTLIEKILTPLVPFLKSYIKDDFLRKLPRYINYPCSLFTCDIESLYTSIPTSLGLEAVRYWLVKKHEIVPDRFTHNFVMESLDLVLLNNNFLFDNELYHQNQGTAMGTPTCTPMHMSSYRISRRNQIISSHLTNIFFFRHM